MIRSHYKFPYRPLVTMEGGNGFESFGWVYVHFHYLQFLSGEKASNPVKTIMTEKDANLAILLVTLLGWFSDPFKWLSDLQLGDEKVTLNQLDSIFFFE